MVAPVISGGATPVTPSHRGAMDLLRPPPTSAIKSPSIVPLSPERPPPLHSMRLITKLMSFVRERPKDALIGLLAVAALVKKLLPRFHSASRVARMRFLSLLAAAVGALDNLMATSFVARLRSWGDSPRLLM